MKHETVYLPDEGEEVSLDTYVAEPTAHFTRRALLVIPGGGYGAVCHNREGEPIAQAFLPYGYNAFVLHYTVGRKKTFPAQLIQVAKAIRHIKDNAEKYGIDPDKLFVVGFSAGGHLAGCAATMWKHPAVKAAVKMPEGYNRPAGAMLIYPVVSPRYEHHIESFRNLWGTDTPTEEQLKEAAVELHVDADSAPVFLLHTADDGCVDVRNALRLAEHYSMAGRPFEMHIYPSAPHGGALFNAITSGGNPAHDCPNAAEWVRLAAAWADGVSSKH